MNVLEEYEQMLIGRTDQIPQAYFTNEIANERLSLMVFKYAIENLLGWSPEDASRFLSPYMVNRMKLGQFMKYIRFPEGLSEENTDYIVHLLYPKKVPFKFEKYAIEDYKKVLAGERKYPKDFMFGYRGLLRAYICLNYAMAENLAFEKLEDVYDYFATKGIQFLKEYKLYPLYTSFFSNPVDYLHEALPDGEKTNLMHAFYAFKYKYYTEKGWKRTRKSQKEPGGKQPGQKE